MLSPTDILLARQPILNSKNAIFGYELLYRSKEHKDKAKFSDGDAATSELLLNACASINEDEVITNHPLFFNVTRNLLLSDSFFPVESNSAIIEILETVSVDDELTRHVYKLKRMGYQFALDDYTFSAKFDALVPLVKFIKIDVLRVDVKKHVQAIQKLQAAKKILVAEKVETLEMFTLCKQLGFKLFQGFYLEKPQIIEGRKISANVNLALSIINELQQEDVNFDDISYLVSKDPKLSFQLLKILNSPAQGLKREVSSLKQAVVFLGVNALKKWVILISLLQSSDTPQSFFNILLTRARTCELLARTIKLKDADAYFTIGLFSGLDRLFSMEMKDVLKHIKVPQEFTDALLLKSGFKGKTLQKVLYLERADWDSLYRACPWSEAQLMSKLMEDARDWSEELLSSMTA